MKNETCSTQVKANSQLGIEFVSLLYLGVCLGVFNNFVQLLVLIMILCPILFWFSMKLLGDYTDNIHLDDFGRRTCSVDRSAVDSAFSIASSR